MKALRECWKGNRHRTDVKVLLSLFICTPIILYGAMHYDVLRTAYLRWKHRDAIRIYEEQLREREREQQAVLTYWDNRPNPRRNARGEFIRNTPPDEAADSRDVLLSDDKSSVP